jgi:hypothetical protein
MLGNKKVDFLGCEKLSSRLFKYPWLPYEMLLRYTVQRNLSKIMILRHVHILTGWRESEVKFRREENFLSKIVRV